MAAHHRLRMLTHALTALVVAFAAVFAPPSFAETASVGTFGPSLPFQPGVPSASSVMLDDGTVLVTGVSTTAYRYDPAGATFTPTGPLAVPRVSSIPARLPDGRVLVASGAASPSEARAEIYDLATNTWTLTGSVATARQWFATLTDLSGRVFLLGGQDASGHALASVERYDAQTGQFVPAPPLGKARAHAAFVRLQDGRFLLAGGIDANGNLDASAEIYNPANGTSQAAYSLTYPTYGANLVLLQDGQALLTGGMQLQGSSLRVSYTAELFNPTTRRFTRKGNMAWMRLAHTATVLPSGKVLLTGGLDDFGQCLSNTEIFDPESPSSLFDFRTGPPMPNPHCFHSAAALANGSVLLAGGAFDNSGSGDATSTVADRFDLDAVWADGFEP